MLELDRAGGQLIARSAREAKRLAAVARRRARGRGAKAKLRAAEQLENSSSAASGSPSRSTDASAGEDHRPAGLDLRPGRPADPQGQARQAERVRVRGADLRGDREHPQGARGLILPAGHQLGNPAENTLLPHTVAELDRLGIRPREVAPTAGSSPARPKTRSPT